MLPVAEGSEAGRWMRGRPRLRGRGFEMGSWGEGVGLVATTGDREAGLPWLLGVGRGEGTEGKADVVYSGDM